MFAKKTLTSKVFITKDPQGGFWNVILGSRVKANLPFGSYGIVLERHVILDNAKEAAAHFQEIIGWRNQMLTALFANARLRAKLVRNFFRESLDHKWRSSKIVVQKKKNTSLVGPTYVIKIANDFVSPRKWVTLPTDFITSEVQAIHEAKEYVKLIKLRNYMLQKMAIEQKIEASKEDPIIEATVLTAEVGKNIW